MCHWIHLLDVFIEFIGSYSPNCVYWTFRASAFCYTRLRKTLTDKKRTPSDHGLKENIKKLRKLERHFSDEILEKLNYEDLTKIKKGI